jgi:hypothetical protein
MVLWNKLIAKKLFGSLLLTTSNGWFNSTSSLQHPKCPRPYYLLLSLVRRKCMPARCGHQTVNKILTLERVQRHVTWRNSSFPFLTEQIYHTRSDCSLLAFYQLIICYWQEHPDLVHLFKYINNDVDISIRVSTQEMLILIMLFY